MKLTTENIDSFVRQGISQGCKQFAWQQEEWDTLCLFATQLGWNPPQKSGDSYLGAQHYLIEEIWQK